ncbi:MAG: hypothetical protein KME07_21485 [Pegethrix bostrychoides GSE-TBD4-15B]|jgi:hypothetical protein|uniref:Uncharacterized protein n=1 Tax=Pegethrix bostrychoides GSE-TBD4-15B TaxID=2839662 RepID=A0A951PE87_9CYAN|nr:hypothetical protein [Pegethrix bostrychoides GSE-TBD4-15B]
MPISPIMRFQLLSSIAVGLLLGWCCLSFAALASVVAPAVAPAPIVAPVMPLDLALLQQLTVPLLILALPIMIV